MITVLKGTIIKIQATVNPGLNQTVSSYHWYLDNVQIVNNNYIYQLNTSQLSIGKHTVKFEAFNTCENSNSKLLEINIIEGNKMDINVTINQPVVNVPVTLNLSGTANVTVKDQLTNPVTGVSVIVKTTAGIPVPGLSTTTDILGVASILNIPYGNYILTVG